MAFGHQDSYWVKLARFNAPFRFLISAGYTKYLKTKKSGGKAIIDQMPPEATRGAVLNLKLTPTVGITFGLAFDYGAVEPFYGV